MPQKMCSDFLHDYVFARWFYLNHSRHFGEADLGPEDELRCSFCKEERMAREQNLKNCRIVGPIFLAMGFFFLSATIIVHTSKPKENPAERVIARSKTGQISNSRRIGQCDHNHSTS